MMLKLTRLLRSSPSSHLSVCAFTGADRTGDDAKQDRAVRGLA